jgi:hypothetical protein
MGLRSTLVSAAAAALVISLLMPPTSVALAASSSAASEGVGYATVTAVSCASAGNCSAGGYYLNSAGEDVRAFVVTEKDGSWGDAELLPGSVSLDDGGSAYINSMSCASAGDCSAGGDYTTPGKVTQPFVVIESDGSWGKAELVPGIGTLNLDRQGSVGSVSCASAGNCSAGGDYTDAQDHAQAFVANEVNGSWGAAEEMPGTAVLNKNGSAGTSGVSCRSPGNCTAVGGVADGDAGSFFVASEKDGVWGKAELLPGAAELQANGLSTFGALSCGSVGNCSTVGRYATQSTGEQVWVANEISGTWGKAEEVPSTAALNAGYNDSLSSLSCPSPGNCSAGGYYWDSSQYQQAFVVDETAGSWGKAEEVPGTATLNQGDPPLFGPAAGVSAVSCGSAGNCAAGGSYTDKSANTQAFIDSEKDGDWGKAEEVPGTAALNAGGTATVLAVSCGSADSCIATGTYIDSQGHGQVFVTADTNGTWGKAGQFPGLAALEGGAT